MFKLTDRLEAIKREFLSHVRPEILERCHPIKPDISFEELSSMQINGYERQLIYERCSLEALAMIIATYLPNCSSFARYSNLYATPVVYEEVLICKILPVLLRKLANSDIIAQHLAKQQIPQSKLNTELQNEWATIKANNEATESNADTTNNIGNSDVAQSSQDAKVDSV